MNTNEEFCKELGLKKACCSLLNKDTGEIRYYTNLSGLYKKPKGWKHIIKNRFDSIYPDLTNPYNFSLLINAQWYLFGELQDVYKRTGNETFEENYLKTRLQAIKLCKSLGGGEMLDEYKRQLKTLPWRYDNE